jgi:hypothetical protein
MAGIGQYPLFQGCHAMTGWDMALETARGKSLMRREVDRHAVAQFWGSRRNDGPWDK